MSNVHNNEPLLNVQTSQPIISPTNSERRRHYGTIRRLSHDSPRGIPETIVGNNNIILLDNQRSTLSFIKRLGFGLGHIYNDLCAGVWFSYTLLFLQSVLLVSAPLAGVLVMLGQVADALATPIIGLLTDRFGTKRQWHIFGTILTFLTFPMIFSFCPFCDFKQTKWWPMAYFLFFIITFQFAWATVQITHLAMIPEMSITQKDRCDLTATRYAASICANVIVYVITWAMLKSHKVSSSKSTLGPEDAFRFRDISLILTLIGTTMTVLFHFSLAFSGYERRRLLSYCVNTTVVQQDQYKELTDDDDDDDGNDDVNNDNNRRNDDNNRRNDDNNRRNDDNNTDDESLLINSHSNPISHTALADETNIEIIPNMPINLYINFFKTPLLYQNALLYVFSRLFVTTSLIYMPLWLNEKASIKIPKPTIDYTNINNNSMPEISEDSLYNQDVQDLQYLATVPLVSFLAAFISSMSRKYTSTFIGHELAYLIGSIIGIVGCFWVALFHSNTFTTEKLYLVAILFGSGSSITMISSLCVTADMIGENVAQGGFIYSAVTFCDKLITGIVIVVIESLKCQTPSACPEYYKRILSFGCGTSALCGILTLITLQLTKARNNRDNASEESNRTN